MFFDYTAQSIKVDTDLFHDDTFIERGIQERPQLAGWITPRKRPRRVHKKLATRGFARKVGRHGAGEVTHWTERRDAPRLAAAMRSNNPAAIVFLDRDRVLEDGVLRRADEHEARLGAHGRYRIATSTSFGLDMGAIIPSTVEAQEVEVREFGHAFRLEPLYSRRVHVLARIHFRDPFDEDRAGALLGRQVARLERALVIALGPNRRRAGVFARQSCYRPRTVG